MARTVTTTLRIGGMTCEHCKRAVFTALGGVPGIRSADVKLGSVEIEHDGSVTLAQLQEAIALAGYTIIASTDVEGRRSLPLASDTGTPDTPEVS